MLDPPFEPPAEGLFFLGRLRFLILTWESNFDNNNKNNSWWLGKRSKKQRMCVKCPYSFVEWPPQSIRMCSPVSWCHSPANLSIAFCNCFCTGFFPCFRTHWWNCPCVSYPFLDEFRCWCGQGDLSISQTIRLRHRTHHDTCRNKLRSCSSIDRYLAATKFCVTIHRYDNHPTDVNPVPWPSFIIIIWIVRL